MDSGILMQQDSILVCSPNLRIPHTAKKVYIEGMKKLFKKGMKKV
jgi:hypothetical protein